MKLKHVGLAIVSAFFFVGGVGHFTSTGMFVRIVPPYIPYAVAAVYVSGVFELLGAVGIWPSRSRQWAGNGLIALTLCVTPANVYMWMNPTLFPDISETLLGVRLILQVFLVALILWATRVSSTARVATQ